MASFSKYLFTIQCIVNICDLFFLLQTYLLPSGHAPSYDNCCMSKGSSPPKKQRGYLGKVYPANIRFRFRLEEKEEHATERNNLGSAFFGLGVVGGLSPSLPGGSAQFQANGPTPQMERNDLDTHFHRDTALLRMDTPTNESTATSALK